MTATSLQRGENSAQARGPEPSMPPAIAVTISGPLTYIFELFRGGVYAGGGRIDAPSPEAAARTVAMTMAGGAEVHIVGHAPLRVTVRTAS